MVDVFSIIFTKKRLLYELYSLLYLAHFVSHDRLLTGVRC